VDLVNHDNKVDPRPIAILEALKPMISDSLTYSRVAHRESLVKIIYEREKDRLQIKQEKTSIKWFNASSLKMQALTGIPLDEFELNRRLKIVVKAIAKDIKRLFVDDSRKGNIELNLKFRDSSLISVTRTEYESYAECVFRK
jgi:hypothetical protein